MPVAIAFLFLDIVGLLLLFGPKGLSVLAESILDSVANYNLSPIPLFILLGEILFRSRAVDVCFNAMDKWVGSVKARLHIVTIIFSVLFGAISGAAMATVAILGSLVLPEMIKRGYDRRLSLGVCMAGSTLDPLIPPSVLAVLVASLANVSVAKLLIAGVGPGLLMGFVYMAYIVLRMWLNPELAPSYKVHSSLKEKLTSLLQLLPFLVLIFLVIGLILLGIATPTESAATGVVGSFIVALMYGHLDVKLLRDSLVATVKITAMILIILSSSKAYSQILAISGAAREMVAAVTELQLGSMGMLIVMQGIVFVLGCFLDQYAIMMITIPIYVPVIEVLGLDPLWFWCLFLINMTLGGVTPPFGYLLFVLKSVARDSDLEDIFRGAIPFVVMMILGIILIAIFPGIAVWLPNHVFK
jgi:tripartite ATP-independent transporter DctM subunit